LKLGIRLKLFLISLGLIAVSVIFANVFLTREVESQLTDGIRQDLIVRAQLVARESSAFPAALTDVHAWQTLAVDLGRAAEARVTLVGRDGKVLGDSGVDEKDLAALENHAARPEIVTAIAGGRGESTRLSVTVRQRLMYVALPFERDGAIAGVARTAAALDAVDQATGRVRNAIILASALAVLVAILLSSLAAQRMSRVVRELTDTARQMTAGDLAVRARLAGDDELAELGTALDRLAASLSRTLAELRAERDLQGSILDGMQEGVLVLDKDGRVVMMNPALRAMLLVGTDAKGKLFMEVLRHAELHELMNRAREEGEPARGEIDLPGIKPRRLLVHAAALAGDAAGLLAVLVDVTDLRRLESLRRDFVANVSHELRTPVTAVRSAAETLRTSALRDPVATARFVDIIDRNGERLQSLIEDLLELSRLESKEFRLRKEAVDIDVVFRIVLGLFRERAEKKGVHLSARLAPGTRPLPTDQRALEQVLSNLIENAIKYCPPGSEVALSAIEDRDGLLLTVADTGPGIDAKHLPRLFERFYRVDAGRSRELGGTGLGLSIVKHLVEALGGAVSVESAVGKGSVFSVRLPEAG
jgi:two-component system, OmpR family, phosphate regulon sensor histidine kinase PhoR